MDIKSGDKSIRSIIKNRKFWFKIISISIPFIAILMIEIVLRKVEYGEELSLFKEYSVDKRFYVINEKVGMKYFTNKSDVTVAKHDIFLKKKTNNTYRIFILGASSSIGFPYKNATTFDVNIKYQLSHMFHDKNIEVVNLSLTAVCSYTLLDIAKNLNKYEPDLVLIYAGHNEYYGTLGVGSSSKMGSNKAVISMLMKARESRIFQWFQNIFFSSIKGKKGNKQLMERMADKKRIYYNSKSYKKGISQFRKNMSELCVFFKNLNTPVLISTIVSNEKDLKPFISKNFEEDESAELVFNIANEAYKKSNYFLAKEKYVQAKEWDLLRFRAPSEINTIIKLLSREHDNVFLVDSKKEMEEYVKHKILGKEVILEHVHPNLIGHQLISNAFINVAREQKLISDIWPSKNTINKMRKNIPFPKVDSIRGEYVTLMMKEDWPFEEPIPDTFSFGETFEEKAAYELVDDGVNWVEKMNKIKNHYFKNKNFEELRKILEKQAVIYGYDRSMQINAGGVNGQLKNNKRAIHYYLKAHKLMPDSTSTHSLAILYLKQDQPEKAYKFFDYMDNDLSLNIGKKGKKILEPIIELKNKLLIDSNNKIVLKKIASKYDSIKFYDCANKYRELEQKIE